MMTTMMTHNNWKHASSFDELDFLGPRSRYSVWQPITNCTSVRRVASLIFKERRPTGQPFHLNF